MRALNFPRINERLCGQATPGAVFYIAPGYAVVCSNATLQISAFTNDGATDTAVSAGDVTWASSDTSKATVSAGGLVTRVADGSVVISATYNSQTAYAALQMFTAATCCVSTIVGTMLVLDRSPSMIADFGPVYASAFTAEKMIAAAVISVLATKDYMAIMEFDGAPSTVSQFIQDKTLLTAALNTVFRSDSAMERTDIFWALRAATDALNENPTITRRVVLLISDGVVEPEPGSAEVADLTELVNQFKQTGGVIVCVGMNASGAGYRLLRDIATPGFFINVDKTAASVSASITALLALRTRYCAG